MGSKMTTTKKEYNSIWIDMEQKQTTISLKLFDVFVCIWCGEKSECTVQ